MTAATTGPGAPRRRPRVVVVGAGFGGIATVRGLRDAPVDTLLVDRHNHHLFTPLLYQVASALLDPSEIAQPVRAVVRGVRNCEVRLATVTGVDLDNHVVLTDSAPLAYDHLVLAAGSVTEDFGVPGVAEHAFALKDIGDALALRNRLLGNVERAVWSDDTDERSRLLSVVVVGGGPTGVECAGAMAELFALMLRKDFPTLRREEASIGLVEAAGGLLGAFTPRLRDAALRTLRRRGVDVRLRAAVEEVTATGLRLRGGEELPAGLVVWTAGVRAAATGAMLGPTSAHGRVPVDGALRIAGHPEVHVIGDLAERLEDGVPLPMLAPVAIQEGRHVAAVIAAATTGAAAPEPFRYHDRGTMATIGRNAAVAQIGRLRLTGFPGWVTWLLVHLVQIIGFRNRVVVLVTWAWDYIVLDRPVRLIARAAAREDDAGTPA